MTTITASRATSIRLSASPTRTRPTRLRLTVRGRRVLAAATALPFALAVSAAMVAGGGAVATLDQGAGAASFESVTVASGETLWSIAQDIAPAADPRDVVDAISRLNALDGAGLIAGQQLAIPSQYDSIR